MECVHWQNVVIAETGYKLQHFVLQKKILRILVVEIFKQIICGKYGSNGEFLMVEGPSKTLANRIRKLQDKNLDKMSFSF